VYLYRGLLCSCHNGEEKGRIHKEWRRRVGGGGGGDRQRISWGVCSCRGSWLQWDERLEARKTHEAIILLLYSPSLRTYTAEKKNTREESGRSESDPVSSSGSPGVCAFVLESIINSPVVAFTHSRKFSKVIPFEEIESTISSIIFKAHKS